MFFDSIPLECLRFSDRILTLDIYFTPYKTKSFVHVTSEEVVPGQTGGGNLKNVKSLLLKQNVPTGCQTKHGVLLKHVRFLALGNSYFWLLCS